MLPLKERAELRLRVVAKPDPMVAQLLQRLGVFLPRTPNIGENVVEKQNRFILVNASTLTKPLFQ